MTKTDQNFTMFSGDYRELVYTVTGITDHTAVDSAVWVLRQQKEGGDSLVKTLGAGIGIVDGTGCVVVTVTLDHADTEGLHGKYCHELQVVVGTNRPDVAAAGTATILFSMTNAPRQ
jgi:hypothetical protein